MHCYVSRTFFIYLWGCSGTKVIITVAIYWPIVPALHDGMIVKQLVEWTSGKENWSTWRKSTLLPLCPPQIPHDLNQDGTQAAAVGSQWVTTSAKAQYSRKFTSLSAA
jgi:hypothetical protein